MKGKAFSITALAVLAAAVVPLAAQAGNQQPQRGHQSRLLHRTIRLDRKVIRADRRTVHADHKTVRADRRTIRKEGQTPATGGRFFAGSVTSASSSSVTVDVLWTGKGDTQLDGRQVTVAISSDTQIVYGKGQTSIDPGDLVRIHAAAADAALTSLTAKKIHVDCNCHWIGGTLTAISPGLIRVNVARTGPYDKVLKGNEVKVNLDSSTMYVAGKDRHQISLSDLSLGDKVGVVFAASGFFKDPNFDWQNATFTAKRVHLFQRDATPTPDGDGAAGSGGQNP